jgi:serine phosphatase RsbU (regulator of sigma subunit)
MSLKIKLIFIVAFEVMLTVAVAGFFGYRESKWAIKSLAEDLLVAKTEQAFSLCEHHYSISDKPTTQLMNELSEIRVAENGYVAVIGYTNNRTKGIGILHPTSVDSLFSIPRFNHIVEILQEIDANGRQHGYNNFKRYQQETPAKGRQGEWKISYFKYFEPWDWMIISTGYEKDVYSSRDRLRKTLVQLVVIVLVIGVIVIYLTIRHMFIPVQHLTQVTQEVARGNWDISIENNSEDEIGTLSRAFNQMVRSLRVNAHIWHEFKIARTMQAEMLPDKFPDIAGIEVSAKSIPAKEVGGDFYDFLDLNGQSLGIVVGDVSGHGVSAAMVMTAAMGAVRFAAEDRKRTDDVLNVVNLRLNKDIQNQMFVALFYCIYNPHTRMLYYTNAGQTMPYLFRNGKITFLPQAEENDRFPLGIVRDAEYRQMSLQLQAGDVLVMYTDGIVDAMNGTYESYGFERFSDSILRHTELSTSLMVKEMVNDMRSYVGKDENFDDVTLVIVKIK